MTVTVTVIGRGLTPKTGRGMVFGRRAGQGAAHVAAAEVMLVVVVAAALQMARQRGVRQMRQMAVSSWMLS